MPKRAREPEPEPDSELYPVETILGARRTHEPLRNDSTDSTSPWFGQGWKYLIKWEGYPEPTWEPFAHVQECQEHLRKFWEDAGEEVMVTNIADFEIRARPQGLHASASMGSPTKKTKRHSQKSPSRRSQARLAREEPPVVHNRSLKIKFRPPIASTSLAQTPTNSTMHKAPASPPTPPNIPTPTAPLSPPLTPEPEPADYLSDTTFIPLFEFDSSATPGPTLVPDEHVPASSRCVPDVYLNTWQPVDDGSGVQPQDLPMGPAENGSSGSSLLFGVGPDSDLVNFILDTPSNIFLN
ncbi:hypothetical protein B0H12DRAFT_1236183 [Mycena haematopus]|nr:hypothetical protein B0H12DRAFT_1236183 [Mycena haematopus]